MRKDERAYEKYAWVLLFAVSILTMIVGLSIFLGPAPSSAKVLVGTFGPGMSIFSLAIILKPYREGEKWAWYALWYWPVFFLVHIATLGTFLPDLPILITVLLGLLLPYGKFFPRKSPKTP